MPATTAPHRELDARAGDGLDIRLLWDPTEDALTVTVADARTDEFFVIPVAPGDALMAFHHPFACAATHRRPRRDCQAWPPSTASPRSRGRSSSARSTRRRSHGRRSGHLAAVTEPAA